MAEVFLFESDIVYTKNNSCQPFRHLQTLYLPGNFASLHRHILIYCKGDIMANQCIAMKTKLLAGSPYMWETLSRPASS